jgi:hypothetical protein
MALRPPPPGPTKVVLQPGGATAAVVGIDQTSQGVTNAVDVTDRLARALGKASLTDGALNLALLNAAPGSDTGQVAVPVRVISQLGGGGGGSTVNQGTAAAGSGAWPVELTEDTTDAIVKAGDAANKALRVNLVAGGGAGGGAAQLQVFDGAAWVNVRDTAESATVKHVPTKYMGTGANVVEPLNANPAGTEYALPVRNIPSGTQPVSAAALPLPAGAAADATLTSGTAKAIVRGGAKGATVAADVTSTPSGANHNGADVVLYDAAGNLIDPRSIRALTATDVVTTTVHAGAKGATAAADVTSTAEGVDHQALDVQLWHNTGTINPQVIRALTSADVVTAAQGAANATPWNENVAQFGGVATSLGQKVAASSIPVVPSSDWATIDATFKALRVSARPPEVLGGYSVSGRTGTYGGLAANTPLWSMRWGDATRLAIILKVYVGVITSVSASTAGITERQLIIARAFSIADTGGTAVTLTGNNAKRRTSMGTSLVTDMRFGNPLTAGTRTLDAAPVHTAVGWSGLLSTGWAIGACGNSAVGAARSTEGGTGLIPLLDATNGQDYPIVLAQNEGVIVRLGTAEPAGATQETFVTVVWLEATAY